MKVKVERSYLVRVVQVYEVDLPDEVVESAQSDGCLSLSDWDDDILAGELIRNVEEGIDDDEFELRIVK